MLLMLVFVCDKEPLLLFPSQSVVREAAWDHVGSGQQHHGIVGLRAQQHDEIVWRGLRFRAQLHDRIVWSRLTRSALQHGENRVMCPAARWNYVSIRAFEWSYMCGCKCMDCMFVHIWVADDECVLERLCVCVPSIPFWKTVCFFVRCPCCSGCIFFVFFTFHFYFISFMNDTFYRDLSFWFS